VDAVIPTDAPLADGEVWVSLRGWHILGPPVPRLMVFDTVSGSTEPLRLAKQLVEKLEATATLRERHKRRQDESDLTEAELRIRYGDAADQIMGEQAETPYEMVILAPAQKRFTIPDPRADGIGGDRKGLAEIEGAGARRERGGQQVLENTHMHGGGRTGQERRTGRGASRAPPSGQRDPALCECPGGGPGPLARVHLERAAATLRSLDVEGDIRYRQAETASAGILTEASEGAFDLIVVGGHGPGSRKLFKLSDVTKQVVAGSDCPVLVVPSDVN
jgi:nucleotide-binding universal stress UspA family protein